MNKRELRETTRKIYDHVLESETGKVYSTITKTQNTIEVTGLSFENVTSKVSAEIIRENENSESK